MTRELTLHYVTEVTRRPLSYHPAGSVKGIANAYGCQQFDIKSEDGVTFSLILFADDPAVLAPMGVVWNPPATEISPLALSQIVDPEAVDLETLPPSDTPTTDRTDGQVVAHKAPEPELAEAVA